MNIKENLIRESISRNHQIDTDLCGYDPKSVLDVLESSSKVKEWQGLIDDYPVRKDKDLHIFFIGSSNPNWSRGRNCSPSFKHLYDTIDDLDIRDLIETYALHIPLGIIPEKYFPIKPEYDCPGVQRWFVEKHDLEWDWRHYRDIILHQGKILANFIHENKLKRKHLIFVRKNDIYHDIVRTASSILDYQVSVAASVHPLWSEEGADYIKDQLKLE